MGQKNPFFGFIVFGFLASVIGESLLACGGMAFPGSYLCYPTSGSNYTTGYPTLTASLVYLPTSWFGGSSQPINYPPNPYATKPSSSATSAYGYGSPTWYPSFGYGYPTQNPSLGYGYGSTFPSCKLPSYGYGANFSSCGGTSGLLGGMGGLTGYDGWGGNSLLPLYGLTGGGVLGGYPGSSNYGVSPGSSVPVFPYPVTTNPPALTVLNPSSHGCSPTNGMGGGNPVYVAPRPVCVTFCGAARNLMRPISRGFIQQSNRLY